MWQQAWWATHYLAVTPTPFPTLPGYVDVGVIPEGARDILVKEVEEAGNFLALKSEASEKYFLNGNFIIQWNGEYEAGGTTFFYERSGNMENLTAPGPTKQPVMLQVGRLQRLTVFEGTGGILTKTENIFSMSKIFRDN